METVFSYAKPELFQPFGQQPGPSTTISISEYGQLLGLPESIYDAPRDVIESALEWMVSQLAADGRVVFEGLFVDVVKTEKIEKKKPWKGKAKERAATHSKCFYIL